MCLILPDPEDGLAATCQTVEAIEAGRGALTLLPRAGTTRTQALAAAIVPDGGAAPALGTPDGTRKLDVTNNVAATVADLGSELRTEAGTLKLSASATK